MVVRARNRRGEGERLRDALLDAATELLAETQDVEQLSVRTITARAGVSPTALYLHFEDKEQLTTAVKHRSFAALGEALEHAKAQHPGDALVQLRAMGHAYLRFAREQPGQYAICFRTQGFQSPTKPRHDLDADDNSQGIAQRAFGLLVDTVHECIQGRADPLETSYMLWSAMHGRVTLREAMPTLLFPDDDRFLDLLINTTIHPLSAATDDGAA
jgi:AcrR family transcriptional regulator